MDRTSHGRWTGCGLLLIAVAASCHDNQGDGGDGPGAAAAAGDGDDAGATATAGAENSRGGSPNTADGGGGGDETSAGAAPGTGGSGGSTGLGGNEAGGGAGGAGGEPVHHCACPTGHVYQRRRPWLLEYPVCEPSGECSVPHQLCYRDHAITSCATGSCLFSECEHGWGDCDGQQENGCETDLESVTNCGTCGNECGAGQTCKNGGCVDTCAPPYTECGGRCVNLGSDPRHCGACGVDCKGGECGAGICLTDCLEQYVACGNDRCELSGCTFDPCLYCPPDFEIQTECRPSLDGAPCCRSSPDLHYDPNGRCENDRQRPTCGSAACRSQYSLMDGLGSPGALALANGTLFWADSRTREIRALEPESGDTWTVAYDLAKPTGLAIGDGQVYFSDSLGNGVFRVDVTGESDPVLLAAAEAPGELDLDGTHVYYVEGGGSLMRVPREGGTPQVIWRGRQNANAGGFMVNVAVDDAHVYGISREALSNAGPHTYHRLSKTAPSSSNSGALPSWLASRLSVSGGQASLLVAANLFSAGAPESLQLLAREEVGYHGLPGVTHLGVSRLGSKTYWTNGASLFVHGECPGVAVPLLTTAGGIADLVATERYLYFTVDESAREVDSWLGRFELP